MSTISNVVEVARAALERVAEEAERRMEALTESLEEERKASRDAMDRLEREAPRCRNGACGHALPTREVLDLLEAHGLNVGTEISTTTLLRWSIGFCGERCESEFQAGAQSKRALLAVLPGGGA